MIKMYKTNLETNKLEVTEKIEKGIWINMTNPDEEEIIKTCKELEIEDEFIRYALDYEEKARIDKDEDDGTILYMIDTPIIEKEGNSLIHSTMPLGVIFVRDDYIITVSLKESELLEKIEKSKDLSTFKKSRMLLQMLYMNAQLFLEALKKINKEREVAESVLKTSSKNKEVLHILDLEKGLVYLTTSLKSNELVMEKTMRGRIIKLYEEDQEILEDAIIENRQAIEMSQIYSNILDTTMEAYASIISNNLNRVMKILTSITIIIAIPTLIASFWGMNVPVPFQYNQNGFVITIMISLVLGILATLWLKKTDMLS